MVAVVLALCIGVIFWQPVVTTLLESYLRGYCRKCWNAELKIASIHYSNGEWILEQPSIVTDLHLNQGGRQLLASQIRIKDSWDFLERQINLEIAVADPSIDIGPLVKNEAKAGATSSSFDISLPHFPLMSVNGHIEIPQGELGVYTANQDDRTKHLPFKFEGSWGNEVNGKLQLFLGADSAESSMIISLIQDDTGRKISVDCQKASCGAISNAFSKFFPALSDWQIVDGDINGNMQVVMPKNAQPYFTGDAAIKDFAVENKSLQLWGNVPEVSLHIADTHSDSSVFLEGSCEIPSNASFILKRDASPSWEVTDVKGGIYFRSNKMDVAFDGVCKQGGQSFPMHISSQTADDSNLGIELQVNGRGQDIAMIVPAVFREGLIEKFAEDQLSLVAEIKKISSGVRLEGIVNISDHDNKNKDTINFGCDFTQSANLHQWARLAHWQDVDMDTLAIIMPAMMLWQDEKAGLSVENGWFDAHNLPLDKYIGAVVLRNSKMELDGTADLKGTFDSDQLTLDYGVHDFLLDHDYFTLSIDQFGDNQLEPQSASHSINFKTGDYKGFVPLKNASYVDKKTGLCFSGIKSRITLEPHNLHAADVESFCSGLYLAGSIDVDFSKILEGYADVDIHSHTMEGKLSQLKELFSHFNASPFVQECPFEGNVTFRKEGGHLQFSINPQDVKIDSYIDGFISDGMLTCRDKDISLRDLSSNFTYDHNARTLAFSDIQGSLIVGSPVRAEEYVFAGDHIRLTDLENREAEFDIWVGDKTRDVIRLAGRTQAVKNPESNSGSYLAFILDNSLSHFGDVHPDSFELVLRDWSHVEKFRLSLGFQLKTLLQDVQRFSRTGMMFLSKSLLKGLNDLKTAEGDFKVDLQYDDPTALFTYDVRAQNVAIQNRRFETFQLNGKKKDSSWLVDQLLLDELSMAADVSKKEGIWTVNFLGIRYGKAILAGLEGEYFPDEHLFDAKINLLDVDLAQIEGLAGLKSFVEKYQPHGKMHASGNAQIKLISERPFLDTNAELMMSFKNCGIKDMQLQDISNVPCRYTSQRGISIENVETSLKDSQTGLTQATLHLKKADYDFAHHEIIIDNLSFNIPVNSLSWLSNHLQKSLPENISHKVAETLHHIKQSGILSGSLNVTRAEQHRTIKLALADGKYHFNNNDYDLRKFVVEYDPLAFQVHAEYMHQNFPLHISLRSKTPSMESGELILGGFQGSLLQIHWTTDPKWGILIQKAEGHLDGISVRMNRPVNVNSNEIRLAGEIVVDPRLAAYRLPSDINSLINTWQIGGKYTLKGEWSISPDVLFAWEDKLLFQGILEAENCHCKGYQVKSLTARIEATPKKALVQHLDVKDLAGHVEAEQITLTRDALNHWIARSKLVTVKQFKPSLLRTSDASKQSKEGTFTVRQLDIQDFEGDLSSFHSFVATGRAYVANPPKRDDLNQIVDLPLDTLNKYGLDLSVLSPVVGAIDYEVKQGRVYLKKLKEMYSAGKMSRFYLPKRSPDPSYIDFDGNIHLQIRMKQYNILFKLAELFTVTIDGTLQKPKFSLFKSSDSDDDLAGD